MLNNFASIAEPGSMREPGHYLYDHEADIGVLGIGTSKAEAFAQAAQALMSIITEPNTVTPSTQVDIDCDAPDDEVLLVDWLNALIYEIALRKMLFKQFDIEIHEHRLHAKAWGEPIDPDRHHPSVEIKGATYTTLDVHRDSRGNWHARTVVDV